jgi:Spy/CpxP family protein refolding chaperone
MQANIRTASFWSLAIFMAIAWTISSVTTSWANVGHGDRHRRPDATGFIWHVLKAKDTLKLNEEQQARLRTIAVNFKKENVKKTAEVDLAEIEMHQLLHGDTKQVAGGDVETAVRKMYALKAEQRLASIKAFQEARTVLTPEQQQKLRELREERHAAMDRRDGQQSAYRSDGR